MVLKQSRSTIDTKALKALTKTGTMIVVLGIVSVAIVLGLFLVLPQTGSLTGTVCGKSLTYTEATENQHEPTAFLLCMAYQDDSTSSSASSSLFFGPALQQIPASNVSYYGVGATPLFPVVNITLANDDPAISHRIVSITEKYLDRVNTTYQNFPNPSFFYFSNNHTLVNYAPQDTIDPHNFDTITFPLTISPGERLDLSVMASYPNVGYVGPLIIEITVS